MVLVVMSVPPVVGGSEGPALTRKTPRPRSLGCLARRELLSRCHGARALTRRGPHLFGRTEHTPTVPWIASSRAPTGVWRPARCDRSVVHAHSPSDMLGGSKRRDIDFVWR